MKDNVQPCQHSLSQDVIYKEVVIIGNGPSGMVTSFMLAGNVPYLKQIPEDLPIDDMLRARLSNIPPGQSLYEADLLELAEGLEGRCQNPIPLLMDNLLRPCADLGIQADSLIEWRFEEDKKVDHIVLGRGPPGGAWHSFPPGVRTLSPGAWLTLPPHADAGAGRLSARAVANYCRRYVHACKLQRYFRSGVVVTNVSRAPHTPGPPCPAPHCPTGAKYYVTARESNGGRQFVIACTRVVLAAGGTDRPNVLRHVTHATHDLASFERALHSLHADSGPAACALVIGSGVSAADAVLLARAAGLAAHHVHRTPADALARLSPQAYPDYCHVYKMMCDGPQAEHPNYTPHPEHVVVEVTPLDSPGHNYTLQPKRVTLLDLKTNMTTELTVSLIGVFIGAKPDLFFLQNECTCDKIIKRKMEEKQNFLKNHWTYIKSMLGQSIQSCKSRYLNYTEMNGNDAKCLVPDCNKRVECQCKMIPYFDKCQCDIDPSDGVGFGVDEFKPVECRANPVAVDKSTHEVVRMSGVYALGPLTGDSFVRFIPGGALALVSHIHKR